MMFGEGKRGMCYQKIVSGMSHGAVKVRTVDRQKSILKNDSLLVIAGVQTAA